MQWGLEFLYLNDAPVECNKCYETSLINPVLFLESNLLPGWYMLELLIKLPTVRARGRIYIDYGCNDDNAQSLGMILYSGRMSKRLIHLTTGGQLYLDLQMTQGCFELQHFRLARVTQNFSHSRMQSKLQAMHPQYKVRQGITHKTINDSVQTGKHNLISVHRRNSMDLPDPHTIWTDYCELFEESDKIVPYPQWIQNFDTLKDIDRIVMLRQVERFAHRPLVSIVMPVYNPNSAWFVEAIESVRTQIYTNWELCIADDASSDPAIRPLLKRYAQLDHRIKVVFREHNGHISAASNSALAMAQGEWITLLDHDDVLAEYALFWVVDSINLLPNARLIYSDEDKIDELGARSDHYFKCDWNPDLFYSQNMISHLGVYYAELVHKIGGFREGFEGSQDYDLALRCIEHIAPEQIYHIPRVLYHWRIHADSTAHDLNSKSYAMMSGLKAINEHLDRKGVNAKAELVDYWYRVRYALPDIKPLVSLIIPSRNSLKILHQCVESILTKTAYTNYEILIMDNGSDDPETLRYLVKLATEQRIQVIRDDSPFNYSALNNTAVKLARGEIIGLINNDVEVISPDWLTEMVSHALRPEVGAVGARLWYADDTIQHAGIVLGVHGIAGHVHRFLPKGDLGYCGRAALIQSFSAVTGACLLVRKVIYEEVGGLNETDLQVAGNDVDFCLRVREAGYRNIWTPYAELYHHESSTRGFDDTPEKMARAAKEAAYMHQRWGELLQKDPAYNPNLSLDSEDFTLAWPPRIAMTPESIT